MLKEYRNTRIHIRPFCQSDTKGYFEAVRESLTLLKEADFPWCSENFSAQDAEAWVNSREHAWQTGEEYSFLIIENVSERILGCIGVNPVNIGCMQRFVNCGGWLRASAGGQGFFQEAIRLVAEFAFTECSVFRMEHIVSIDNIASQKSTEKAGAKKEGLVRNRIISQGKPKDAFLYSMVPSDLTN